MYKPTIGNHSKNEETNENGRNPRRKLIKFAIEKEINSTYFQHKEIHKGTWMILRTGDTNQMDHIEIERKHMRSITDAKSYSGVDANTDHILVKAKMTSIQPPKEIRKKRARKKFNTDNLKDMESKTNYQRITENKLQKADKSNNVEERWNSLEMILEEAAQVLNSNVKVEQKGPTENGKMYKEVGNGAKKLCRQKKDSNKKPTHKQETNYTKNKTNRK